MKIGFFNPITKKIVLAEIIDKYLKAFLRMAKKEHYIIFFFE